MSFGFSAGDLISISALAWKVFKSCKEASDSFKNVSSEVVSMHVVLKETEDIVAEGDLGRERTIQLQHVADGCQAVLKDLDQLLDRYKSLGTKSQRTWDRMKWGHENISEIRSRLISNTTLLSTYNATMAKYASLAVLILPWKSYKKNANWSKSAPLC